LEDLTSRSEGFLGQKRFLGVRLVLMLAESSRGRWREGCSLLRERWRSWGRQP
jgi:hypothetical protein